LRPLIVITSSWKVFARRLNQPRVFVLPQISPVQENI